MRHPPSQWTSSVAARLHALVLAVLLVGCGSDSVAPPAGDLHNTFWRLSLNHHAVVMSTHVPHNTVQLVATALNPLDEPLQGVPSVTFVNANPNDTSLTISPSGLVTSRYVTARSAVIARLTVGGITLADTSYIMVRDDAPEIPLQSFSIHPEAPDSNWMWSVGVFYDFVYTNEKQIQVIATDNTNRVLGSDELLAAVWTKNADLLRRSAIYQGRFFNPTGDTGSVMIHAEVNYYGTPWTDSIRLYVIPPPLTVVHIATIQPLTGPTRRAFQPMTTTIPAGTTVRWDNDSPQSQIFRITDLSFLRDDPNWPSVADSAGSYLELRAGDSVDIVFDHPEQVGAGDPQFALEGNPQGGNIGAWTSSSCTFNGTTPCFYLFDVYLRPSLNNDINARTRSFPVPGTYHYHSTRHPDLKGVIVVTDSLRVPPPTQP